MKNGVIDHEEQSDDHERALAFLRGRSALARPQGQCKERLRTWSPRHRSRRRIRPSPRSRPSPATSPTTSGSRRERLDPGAYGYYAGGAGDERTLRENVEAFSRWLLRPRALVDVSAPTTETTVLGTPALDAAARRAGRVPAHRPPGRRAGHGARGGRGRAPRWCSRRSRPRRRPRSPKPRPARRAGSSSTCFRDPGVTRALIDQAVDAGFHAIALTVDAPRLGRRERDLRTGFEVPADVTVPSFAAAVGQPTAGTPADMFARMDPSVSWRDLEQLCSETDLPVLVKGIDDRPRTPASPASTAPPAWSSRTTAAASSTACPRRSTRCRRSSRRSTAASRCSSTAACAAAPTSCGRSRSARVRCSPAARRSGASPRAASRARARCSSCCARRSSSRSCCSAAPRRRTSTRAHVMRRPT